MRKITIEKTVYKYSELSDEAKEKAREHFRRGVYESFSDFHAECVIDDAATIAEMMGISLDKARSGAPAIYYSGFSSQGDGACFEGSYAYKKGFAKAVKRYAPKDNELHEIVDSLQALQKSHRYQLQASMAQRGFHNYMEVNTYHANGGYAPNSARQEMADIMNNFASWIYRRLEKEFDYQNSDEVIDEHYSDETYEFTEDGEIA